MKVSRIKNFLLELFFPVRAQCLGCGDERGCDEPFLCDTCRQLLWPVHAAARHEDWRSHGLNTVYFAYRYARPAKGLIHAFKYRGVTMLASPMAEDLFQLMQYQKIGKYDAIVPIPLHQVRLKKRGYNQSELLAVALSRQCGIPVRTDVVKRILNTRQQAKLTKEKRRANIQGAFLASADVNGMRILLLDDVITTGSTMCACAEVLRDAGARRIDALTFAGACHQGRPARGIYRRKK